jgi:hypothetical protein
MGNRGNVGASYFWALACAVGEHASTTVEIYRPNIPQRNHQLIFLTPFF